MISDMKKLGNRVKEIVKNHKESDAEESKEQVKVYMRCIYERVIEIDTKGEQFDVDVIIESSWHNDQLLRNLLMPQFIKNSHTIHFNNLRVHDTNLDYLLENIGNFSYDPQFFWSPELYFGNSLSLKEEIFYKIKVVPKHLGFFGKRQKNDFNNPSAFVENLTCEVTEVRKVRGTFHETMELHEFPIDKQELAVTVTSKKPVKEVILLEDKLKDNIVGLDRFFERLSWHLFEFCKYSHKEVDDHFTGIAHSHATFRAYVVRKPKSYLYSVYLMLFLITIINFTVFSIPHSAPYNRLSISGILILTAVNFRWIISAKLPSVSYLTFMDQFSLGGIFVQVTFCVWFSVIGAGLVTADTSFANTIENYVLAGLTVVYTAFLIYVLFLFILVEVHKAKFQRDSEKERKEAQEAKKTFAKGQLKA